MPWDSSTHLFEAIRTKFPRQVNHSPYCRCLTALVAVPPRRPCPDLPDPHFRFPNEIDFDHDFDESSKAWQVPIPVHLVPSSQRHPFGPDRDWCSVLWMMPVA